MRREIFLLGCAFLCFAMITDVSAATRDSFSREQKAKLSNANTIFVNVLALTERGRGDAAPLINVITRRLQELDYTIVTDRKQPHDVEFRVKCEEQKKSTGTTRAGGDADQVDSPARLWKGPACLFAYFLEGRDSGWQKEVRTDFDDVRAAAKAANVKKTGDFALAQLKDKLEEYDFPVKLAAQWGHEKRLLTLLKGANTSQDRRLTILSVMPNLQSQEAQPYLKEFQQEETHSVESIAALAATGSPGIPVLTSIFTNTKNDSSIRAAAAKGLGSIGAITGDHDITPPILNYLTERVDDLESSEDIDFPVMTEVVWGLGKLRDGKSIGPLRKLEEKVWLIYDTSKPMSELRLAVDWTIKQVDMDEQAN
ncbi:HEAT repeat domain-containing protein [Nitrospira sp. M1]